MRLRNFLIKHKCLIQLILDIIQIINVFLSIKIVSVLIIITRKIINKLIEEKDETKNI